MMVVWFGDVLGGVWLRPLMNIDKKGKDDDEPLLPIFYSHSGSASRLRIQGPILGRSHFLNHHLDPFRLY